MLPPEDRQSDFAETNGQSEITPGHSFLSSGTNGHRVLLNVTENRWRSEKILVLSKSDPDPPAPNSYGFLDE